MIRLICLSLGLAALAAELQPLVAEEPGTGLTVPVKATGQNTTFFQNFVFAEGTTTFPGISSGELLTGGRSLQIVTRLVPQEVPRTVYRYVLVFEDGRFMLRRVAETVVVTVYVEVQEEREITLPHATGRWTGVDLGFVSSWTLIHFGPDGLIFAAGTTVGEAIFGSALYLGVAEIPSGSYQLSTGEPDSGGGGGGEGDPPPEP